MTAKRFFVSSILTALLLFGFSASATATIISSDNAVDISGLLFAGPLNDPDPTMNSNYVGDDSIYGSAPGILGNPGSLNPPTGARYFTESTTDIGGINFNVRNPSDGFMYGPAFFLNNNPGVFEPGAIGQSHYIFWDPDPSMAPTVPHSSSFIFDAPIIAILWNDLPQLPQHTLFQTDPSLGLPGVDYGGDFFARGLELHNDPDLRDKVNISVSETTLRFESLAGSPGDWFRVITAVPEPSSVLLLGLGLGVLAARRKR